jgi:hypothetical protein
VPDADETYLTFQSWLTTEASNAAVEVSTDGETWTTLLALSASDNWEDVALDLTTYQGASLWLRFVFDAIEPASGVAPDLWRLDRVAVTVGAAF